MPEKSSVDRPGVRAAMLVLNLVPLAHVLGTFACFLTPWAWLAPVVLYVVPLVPGRILREVLRKSPAEMEIGSAGFLKWWACFQCQSLFLRFPVLEEVLRLIPGVYSFWLRCWGSRIGKLTYWAPGTVILDRGFLDIGDQVVFGAGVRLNPHVMENALKLANIRIANDAMIGGYSLLTAGTEIAAGEVTRAFLISPPFSKWQNGKRQREIP